MQIGPEDIVNVIVMSMLLFQDDVWWDSSDESSELAARKNEFQ